jgi:DNA-binding phage protein
MIMETPLTIVKSESTGFFVYLRCVPKHSVRDSISSNLIQALRKERLDQKLSMTAVAERSGLHVSMISLAEREMRKPTLDALLRIAEALQIDLWPLLKTATEKAKNSR